MKQINIALRCAFSASLSFLLLSLSMPGHCLLAEGTAALRKKITLDNQTGVSTEYSDHAEYVSDEVIVKLRERKSAAQLYASSYSDRMAAENTILSDVKTRHGLRDERPLFKALHDKMKSANSSQRMLDAQSVAGAPDDSPDIFPIYVLKTKNDVRSLCRELQDDPDVEYAQPNYIYTIQEFPQTLPNDTFVDPDQNGTWSQGAWGQAYEDMWGLKKIGADRAWTDSQGEGIVVAVIDTGVDYTHEDLAENMWVNPGEIPDNNIDDDGNGYKDDIRGWDFTANANNPLDRNGHGTHCAGTIAAAGHNARGVIGVAPKAKIMAVKGMSDYGSGTTTSLANSIKYAADNGAKVLSNSWAFDTRVPSEPVTEAAITYARSRGCVVVFAAGNSNDDAAYYAPANNPNVITVAASTETDQRCPFSNYGSPIDIAAPGGADNPSDYRNILSSLPTESVLGVTRESSKVADGYYRLAGTSMACPHVAGMAALALAKNNSFTHDEVLQSIKDSADYIVTDQPVGGRLNVYQTLNAIPPREHLAITRIVYENDSLKVFAIINIPLVTSYSLEWKLNGETVFTPLLDYQSFTPGQEFLAGTLNVAYLSEGMCQFKLSANGQQHTLGYLLKRTDINVIKYQYPDGTYQSKDLLGKGVYSIFGSIRFNRIIYYKVEYQKEGETAWQNTAVTLVPQTVPVEKKVIALLDTSTLTSALYKIRLTVMYGGGQESSYIYSVQVDPQIKEGFPAATSWMGDLAYGSMFPADVDGDGEKEIVTGTTISGVYQPHLQIRKSDGSVLFDRNESTVMRPLAAADVNHDGKDEILSVEDMNTAAEGGPWRIHLSRYVAGDGLADLAGFPITVNTSLIHLAFLDDLNRDGVPEIVCLTWDTIEVFKLDGQPYNSHFPIKLTQETLAWPMRVDWPLAVDCNRDGQKEIIVGLRSSYGQADDRAIIRAYDLNGNEYTQDNWPIDITALTPADSHGKFMRGLKGADIDDDNYSDVLFSDEFYLYATDSNGVELTGQWPVKINETTYDIDPQFVPADIQGDQKLEIVSSKRISYLNDALILLDANGNKLWEVPLLQYFSGYEYARVKSIVVGNVTGDARPEIVAAVHAYNASTRARDAALICFDASGNLVKTIHSYGETLWDIDNPSPILSDIDEDGLQELIGVEDKLDQTSSRIFVWDLDGGSGTVVWPMWRHDPQLTATYSVSIPDTQAPTVPANLQAVVASTSTISLTWSASTDNVGVIGYRIYRNGSLLTTTTSTNYLDAGLTAGTPYTYEVSAYDAAGNESAKSTAVTVTILLVPAAITDLSAVPGNTTVTLNWTAPDDNGSPILRYIVEFGTVASGTFTLRVTDDNTPGITVNGLTNGTAYQFRVYAENAMGAASASNVVTATPSTAPAPITDLTALLGNTSITLLWTAPADSGSPILRYRVEFGTVASGDFALRATDDETPGITITHLTNSTAYQFRVYAENANGAAPVSNVVVATPLPNVFWTNLVGVSVSGNSITKTTANGWGNSGASSSLKIPADGGVEFTAPQTATYVMAGLSTSDPNASYSSIQFAIYAKAGTIGVYENGTNRGNFGAYTAGTIFSVERIGTKIYYKKDGAVFYTSTLSSGGDLLADAALYSLGAAISNAKITGIIIKEPDAVTNLAATSGDGQVALTWGTPADNGSPIASYEVQYGTVASGGFATVVSGLPSPGVTVSGLTNGTAYQFRVIAKNYIGSSLVSNVVVATPWLKQNVVWTNAEGVNVSGNSITKTATMAWGNAGAASSLKIPANGSLEFTVPDISNYSMAGLSTSDANTSYISIQFAIYAKAGSISVYESGTRRGDFGSYAAGTTFSVERVGTKIYYKKNGAVFYTSTLSSTGSLLADAALYSQGATITNAKMTGVVIKEPDAITDLGANSDDAQVVLSWSAPVDNGSAITSYEVQYGTVASGGFATVISDITSPGRIITGLTNGTAYQFRVIAKNAIGNSPASNVLSAVPRPEQDVVWTNTEVVNISGNSITKTVATGWGNSGGASSLKIPADGSLEFTTSDNTLYAMVGFSTSDPNTSYDSIQFAIYARAGIISVYENGTNRGDFGNYAAGTTFSLERIGTKIYYKKNGTVFYTSGVGSTGGILVDAALYSQGATVLSARMSGVVIKEPDAVSDLAASGENAQVVLTWSAPADNGSAITSYEVQYGTVASGGFATVISGITSPGRTVTGLTNGTAYQFRVIAKNAIGNSLASNVVVAAPLLKQNVVWTKAEGVSVSGNSITKTATTAWGNAGAVSSLKIPANGNLEFTVPDIATYSMAGLSTSDPNTSYTSIQFAIYAKAGSIAVYESGTKRGDFGSYSAGTTFSVERVGTIIYYKKNGTTFYTSTLTSTGSLLADTALYSQGAIISNAKMTGVVITAPDAVSDLAASGENAQVVLTWSAPADNGSAITSYEVQYGTVASGGFATVISGITSPGRTVTGLTNGTAYQFRVIAKNAIGSSPVSNVATATPIVKEDVVWTNAEGVNVSGNSISKTATTAWGNAGAASSIRIPADGSLEFTATQTTTYAMAGLSTSDANTSYTSIQFAIYAKAGSIAVYESGSKRGDFGSYSVGTTFSVERVGTTIYYKKNGATFYTSTLTSTGSLLADTALYSQGAVISNAKITY